jgi:hypothetical protein
MAEQNKIYTSTVSQDVQSKFTDVNGDDTNTKTLSQLSSLKSVQNTVKVYVKFATNNENQQEGLVISEKYYLTQGGTVGKITDE